MPEFRRTGSAVWQGDLRNGRGVLSSESAALEREPYHFGTRFANVPGTNPEELLAAAHAACYNMALAGTLASHGHIPDEISTTATCYLESLESGGWKITRMHLATRVKVAGLDEAALQEIAVEGERGCPVSNALRPGLQVTLEVTLASDQQ